MGMCKTNTCGGLCEATARNSHFHFLFYRFYAFTGLILPKESFFLPFRKPGRVGVQNLN